jgi:hypothetical protein
MREPPRSILVFLFFEIFSLFLYVFTLRFSHFLSVLSRKKVISSNDFNNLNNSPMPWKTRGSQASRHSGDFSPDAIFLGRIARAVSTPIIGPGFRTVIELNTCNPQGSSNEPIIN